MKSTVRACIYPKDVMRITGKSERSARKCLNAIKEQFGKTSKQFVTIPEFAAYSGIDISIIEKYLID